MRDQRPGGALIALAAIIAITAAWWALALWPASGIEPEWLARTRAACFGSVRGGLPDAGGWILLIGEPIGMLGALLAGWGRAVRRDLQIVSDVWIGRVALSGVATIALVGAALLGLRVAHASAFGGSSGSDAMAAPVRIDIEAPPFALVDQSGRRTTLADFRGQRMMITFAFGHCSTVCPAIVSGLRAERLAAKRPDLPLVVITLDPWRDTPDRLAMLAKHWELLPRDRVLSGAVSEVEGALDALRIVRRRNETTGDVEHLATVLLVDERGRIAWRIDGGWAGVRTWLASGE